MEAALWYYGSANMFLQTPSRSNIYLGYKSILLRKHCGGGNHSSLHTWDERENDISLPYMMLQGFFLR